MSIATIKQLTSLLNTRSDTANNTLSVMLKFPQVLSVRSYDNGVYMCSQQILDFMLANVKAHRRNFRLRSLYWEISFMASLFKKMILICSGYTGPNHRPSKVNTVLLSVTFQFYSTAQLSLCRPTSLSFCHSES